MGFEKPQVNQFKMDNRGDVEKMKIKKYLTSTTHLSAENL